ncbi:ABC transporter permease [Actinoplanes bogorensis]|uniref:ABC transporter permease n=1 Tax=Paractinoplanes bogorensis TaxID=1610840 RepID=A0ABS5YNJ9_9ACTN|nr:FtsX-like permease family protein [Actinoplanes bogorensis]MBU2665035.1 ABC transporter permease [Actinoplanes bogorensis]
MRIRWPRLHWPSVRGRARADAGPLLLTAGVVTAVVLLAGSTPPLIRQTSDDATRDAVRRAADDAAVRVEAEWPDDYGPNGGRMRSPQLAADVSDVAARAAGELDPTLSSALRPPVTSVSSVSLMITDGSVQRRLRLEYLGTPTGQPAVTWVAGRAPGPSTTDEFLEIPLAGPPWPVQVGLSEADAAALGVGPGDRIPVQDERRTPYDVRVTGVFRPADATDPAWSAAPWVLQPAANRDGLGSTRIGALLSPESLPDARLALRSDQLTRVVRFDADPTALTWQSAQALATSVAGLKGGSAVSAERDPSFKWSTRLDSVLADLRDQIATTSAQASVLLLGLLAAALLVLALTADLLTRRRAAALTTARHRGASLPGLAAELTVEAVAVAGPATLLGLALAVALTGSASLTWVAPFVIIALGAVPAFGTVTAARATRDRRTPANRSARRRQRHTGLIRRVALDAAVVAVAAAALVALHQRGLGAGTGGDGALPAAAPALGAVAVTLLLARMLPIATGLVLRFALRSRHPLVLFGAARAAATSARVLPAVALTTALAVGAFSITLYATTQRGLVDGAWQTTGADARLDISSDAPGSSAGVAGRIAAAPGVRHAVEAEVNDNARFIADSTSVPARLIIVDTEAFGRLLADTPLPGLPASAALTATRDGAVPALVRTADGSLTPGVQFRLPVVTNQSIALTAVGAAPALGSGEDTVVIDSRTATAAGLTVEPNTVWATGPGAAQAIRAAGTDGRLTIRTEVLDERRTAPLTSALARLCLIAALVLLGLSVLGFALAAAANAPARWETLARLRTLGLRPRDTRRVAAGELVPATLFAAVLAPPLGALLAGLAAGPLGLRLLTRQASPPTTVTPWWTIEAVTLAVLVVALIGTVAAESATRRRRRLGETLRVGDR